MTGFLESSAASVPCGGGRGRGPVRGSRRAAAGAAGGRRPAARTQVRAARQQPARSAAAMHSWQRRQALPGSVLRQRPHHPALSTHQAPRRRGRQLEVEDQQVAALAGAGLLHNVLAARALHDCGRAGGGAAARRVGGQRLRLATVEQARAQARGGRQARRRPKRHSRRVGGRLLVHRRRVRDSTCSGREQGCEPSS